MSRAPFIAESEFVHIRPLAATRYSRKREAGYATRLGFSRTE